MARWFRWWWRTSARGAASWTWHGVARSRLAGQCSIAATNGQEWSVEGVDQPQTGSDERR